MAYFHEQNARNRGGLARISKIKVIGETIEEQQKLKIQFPDAVTICWPDRRTGNYKTRTQPEVWLNANRTDILEKIGSVAVPKPYIVVLTMMLREMWWIRSQNWTEEMEKWFEKEIRGKTIDWKKSGLKIENPENLSLQKLNERLEKIDLGRRNDLKQAGGPTKYDQDANRTDLDQKLDPRERSYRDGNSITRQQILDRLPAHEKWKRNLWISRYGSVDGS